MVDKIELRLDRHGARLVECRTGCPLRENFEKGCLECPLSGRAVPVSDVVSMVREARGSAALLLQTLCEAEGRVGGA